jgi:cardiolipin synthase A/B
VKPAVPARNGHRVRLLAGAHDLFPAMIAAMAAARHSIHIETYIFDFDGEALDVANALADAALRGVQVHVALDGVGTPAVPLLWQQRWAQTGVQWRRHAPLGRLGLLIPSRWRRLHRKLCVVDGHTAFCGGINIVDDYLDVTLGPLPNARLDFAVQVQGPLVDDVVRAMRAEWLRLPAQRLWQGQPVQAALAAKNTVVQAIKGAAKRIRGQRGAVPYGFDTNPPEVDGVAARLVLRDNVLHRNDIEWAYIDAMAQAQTDIVIAMAYFVPGARLRRVMRAAVRRGVRVHVIVQGRYENFMQFRAARPIYKRLMASGIRVSHYQPSALHAKVAVMDGKWATVGSSNLDPLSLLLAKEANVVITDRKFAGDLHERLQLVLSQSQPVDVGLGRASSVLGLWDRVLDGLAFALMRVALWLTGNRY